MQGVQRLVPGHVADAAAAACGAETGVCVWGGDFGYSPQRWYSGRNDAVGFRSIINGSCTIKSRLRLTANSVRALDQVMGISLVNVMETFHKSAFYF